MVKLNTATLTGVVALCSSVAIAHPGHDVRMEAAAHSDFIRKLGLTSRGMGHCSEKLQNRGLEARSIQRRQAAVHHIQSRRSIKKRTFDPLHTDHHSDRHIDFDTDPSKVFSSDASVILAPDILQGPFYVTGELVRRSIREDQPGVPLDLDIQLIDVNTCEPMVGAYVDVWNCNATGVYSGVVGDGNGNANDKANLNTHFLRGIQQTDSDGVIQFETLFPGYYNHRATHVHEAHASHVTNVFFDESLKSEIYKTYPYNQDPNNYTTNADDVMLPKIVEAGVDPIMQYVYVGDNVTDGLFAWITLGINATGNQPVDPVVYDTQDGAVRNPVPYNKTFTN
ncbi:hypothetical protein ASPWEDRAFT_24240 [Aspergillus wentii DTO 134E9]|uniref:Intradiol ring-cleavage dioxygenases domain-containing protein n=1 Tax=Aspergillus wentii DTO 134E9 TaxID=1073089 RepID=A0A1L9RTT3_ASPWE|nr:uncharacterized protein ASPWEDRAFT_24240 [Aspergillus wentii DTO 134E9]OJJ38293.1 hypothetical protein ASPWEDRAFT_24240 [Aspergillus wentii DTO 134E9]